MLKKNKIIKIMPLFIIITTSAITYNILYTYSLNEYNFTSPIYNIEDKYIKNISTETDIKIFNDYFDLENCKIKVVDKDNKELQKGYVYTGSITQIYNNENELITTYTNIVKGDITKDGLSNLKDIETISSIILNNKNLEDYEKLSIDMNNDNEIKANDIALLKSYQSKQYESLKLNKSNVTLMSDETIRLIPSINPNTILSQNLTWISSNENVATVNNAGKVTAKEEGTATITAITKDGSKTAFSTITVDNTIKLESTSGNIYIGGNNLKIFIKSIDYTGITCSSSNETLATCRIEDKYLIVSLPNTTTSGTNVTITVKSETHGEATFTANIIFTYLNLTFEERCISVNGLGGSFISTMNAGELKFEIGDTDIIKDAYVNGRYFYARAGSKAGNTTVKVTELNGNAHDTYNAIVYRLSLNKIGDLIQIGEEDYEIVVTAENTGNLTCESSDEEVATCKIENNILKVTPLSKGQATITITEDKCQGTTTFLAVVEGE